MPNFNHTKPNIEPGEREREINTQTQRWFINPGIWISVDYLIQKALTEQRLYADLYRNACTLIKIKWQSVNDFPSSISCRLTFPALTQIYTPISSCNAWGSRPAREHFARKVSISSRNAPTGEWVHRVNIHTFTLLRFKTHETGVIIMNYMIGKPFFV